MNIVLVAVGGAVGSVLRYLVGVWALRLAGPVFPWGTLFVNVTGSFLIGVTAEFIVRRFGGSVDLRLLLITGLIGGYTTFSAFTLDALTLLERGNTAAALIYIASSVVVSLLAVFAGLVLTRSIV
ncbi:fluoride efflux transporter CrcB [Rhizobium sp. CFBP 8762]|uniref:fluoride efflux transporter CrcB n=1 Tax=Rhizobium sp. CFBP 8762 TaxID=2775279 RepID=UPI0017807F2B|nr:fluoride efflux transporter CrcB [Rhizobium sp. CFBP 8762]MBD8555886.1 fluoride efflux transporter CrcB [Rhizobium sp. CFBP 8762]